MGGHRNIMSKIEAGGFFAEPYAATPGSVSNISVVTSRMSIKSMIEKGMNPILSSR